MPSTGKGEVDRRTTSWSRKEVRILEELEGNGVFADQGSREQQ